MRPFPLLRKLGIAALVVLALAVSSSLAARVFAAGTAIVFVARAHLATPDDIFQDEVGPAGQFGSGLPKFAPGSKLMLRQDDGSLQTLVDGANPSAATGNLIDVQAPDVSFDGTKILFAGATTVDPRSAQYGWRLYEIGVNGSGFRKLPIPDRTFTSVPNNNAQGFDWGNAETYTWWNDLFPAYLADGRIVFASTRYPSRSHYDARHDYNLYIVNGDGSNLHRITTERGGLLHPTPLPNGQILFSRWWNNFNQPSSKGVYNRIDNRDTDRTLNDGTLIYANPDEQFNPAKGRLPDNFEIRDAPNAWHLHAVNPDGTDFHRFAFTPYAPWAREEDSGGDTYTAAQPALVFNNGTMYIAFTSQQDGTMVHSTQKTGIRVARPGADMLYANIGDAIAGLSYDKAWGQGKESPPYAIHPAGMPDGKILFSYTTGGDSALPTTGAYNDRVTGRRFDLQGSNLQYKLYTMNLDGSAKTELAANVGTADAMDAKVIAARTGWNAKSDSFTTNSNDDPREWNVPGDLLPNQYGWSQKTSANIQTATLHNPNIYANPPLALPFINNSPLPGSVTTAEVWIDANQFTGAFCYDYPGNPEPCDSFKEDVQVRAVKYTTVPVSARGGFTAQVPADVPAFVVLRGADGRAVDGWNRGYISIAQGNAYARPGQTVTCIGCHFGHFSGSILDPNEATAGWTNVAPYAKATASSEKNPDDQYQPFDPSRVNDRRGFVPIPAGGPPNPAEDDPSNQNFQDTETGWISVEQTDDNANGEWVQLKWTDPVKVKAIRLIGPPPTNGDWGGFGKGPQTTPYHITGGTLQMWLNGTQVGGSPLSVGQVEALADGGTQITLNQPTVLDRLRFTVNATAGYWHWETVAALNEIEVIGMDGDASPDGTVPTATPSHTPTVTRTPTVTNTPTITNTPTVTSTPDPCAGVKPKAPQLLAPAQDAKIKTLQVQLDWSDSNCAKKYKITVRLDSETGAVVIKKRRSASNYLTTPLTKNKKYAWQIVACNKNLCTASAWGRFKTSKNAQ
ncbi:MAG: hypothetical protein EYC68_08560 [Chloroflexota bacterium]|nr:MAG: hypothetical protein EYC68_08560 [Chloroflexota bacterium]